MPIKIKRLLAVYAAAAILALTGLAWAAEDRLASASRISNPRFLSVFNSLHTSSTVLCPYI